MASFEQYEQSMENYCNDIMDSFKNLLDTHKKAEETLLEDSVLISSLTVGEFKNLVREAVAMGMFDFVGANMSTNYEDLKRFNRNTPKEPIVDNVFV